MISQPLTCSQLLPIDLAVDRVAAKQQGCQGGLVVHRRRPVFYDHVAREWMDCLEGRSNRQKGFVPCDCFDLDLDLLAVALPSVPGFRQVRSP